MISNIWTDNRKYLLFVRTSKADVRACKSCVFVVGVASQVHQCCPMCCACACVFVAATYDDVDVPFHEALEHRDDILLGSCFLEIRSTCAITFLKEKLGGHMLRLLLDSTKYADVKFKKAFFCFVLFPTATLVPSILKPRVLVELMVSLHCM